MKYGKNNKPLECIMKNSTCYKNAGNGVPAGVLIHDTGAGNPCVKRYVQPHKNDENYKELIKKLGDNRYDNDWNHIYVEAGVNAWIGKLADDSVTTVQTLPWHHRPWGCGSGKNGSCNGVNGGDFWIQIEICDDGYTDNEYFNKVYDETCELVAYLCDKYNIDPKGTVKYNGVTVPTILCHADSYKLGLGSNHNDVLKWFNKYGKTMDDVRNDVCSIIKNTGNVDEIPSKTVADNSIVIKQGDVVKISEDAVYYSGKQIGSWVKNKTWIVREVSGNRAVIDKSEDGKNAICSPIDVKFLTPVSKSENKTTSVGETFTPYLIKVTTDVLRIRKGAGTNYDMVGRINKSDNGVYTIIAEANGKGAKRWGLLKAYRNNRDGWISLDYTKRV